MMGVAAVVLVTLLASIALLAVQRIRGRAKVRRRMAPVMGLLAVETAETTGVSTRKQRRERSNSLTAWLDARYPLARGGRTALIAFVGGAAAFAALVPTLDFFGLSYAVAVVAGGSLGGGLAWNIASTLETARRNAFSDRFLVVLEDMQRMVRYGIPTAQALKSAASAADEPVRTSLRNILLETEFGTPLGAAMDGEARRVRVAELSMLAAAVSTQSTTGGSLSESVDNLARMLRERLDNRSRMKASTAESRITIVILAFVPFAAIGVQALSQPELVDVLLGDARHLLGIGVALIVAGLVISWMMIRGAQR